MAVSVPACLFPLSWMVLELFLGSQAPSLHLAAMTSPVLFIKELNAALTAPTLLPLQSPWEAEQDHTTQMVKDLPA